MRFTRRLTHNAELSGVVIGMALGAIFPWVLLAAGVSRSVAITPVFFAATMMTGGATGLVNFVLAKRIVAPRLRTLAQAALKVETTLRDMSNSPEACLWELDEDLVTIASDDEIGETARAFNRLAITLCESLRAEHAVRSFVGVISTNLELLPLARQALQFWTSQSNACGGVILTESEGKLVLAAAIGVKNPEEVASSDHVTRAFETRASELIVLPENVRLDGVLAEFRPAELLVIPVQYEGVSLGVVVLATATSTANPCWMAPLMVSAMLTLASETR